jgi:hypothetical protein
MNAAAKTSALWGNIRSSGRRGIDHSRTASKNMAMAYHKVQERAKCVPTVADRVLHSFSHQQRIIPPR